jgi:hypothetical protein
MLPAYLLGGLAAGDEVQDKGDDGEEKKQMNEESRSMKHEKSAEPHHDQNNGKYEKHGYPTFSFKMTAYI